MSIFGGDNELGNILQDAVKMKSAQMGQKRKTYETWPFFVQHTLFHGEKENYSAWRQLPFNEKIEICENIKKEGNDLYTKGNFSDAVDKYEEAPTLIYYCVSSDPGWRKNNRGIDDDVITLHDDQGSTPEEGEQHRRLRLTCMLNIAQCKSKLAKFDEAVVACTAALEIDPENVKALYRRAEARIRPGKSTAYDQDCAISDLQKAHKVDPENKLVKNLMKDLQENRKDQRTKDSKTFGGMFDRGEIYDRAELEAEAARVAKSGVFASKPGAQPGSNQDLDLQTLQKRIDNITDDDSLDKRCQDAELLRDLYMRNGKEEEAKELNEKIKTAKGALKEQKTGKTGLDWEHPTDDMVQDAAKYDLDLTDPLVIGELRRLEQEGLSGQVPPQFEEEPPKNGEAPKRGNEQDLPLPKATDETEVPWMKYIALFFVIFLIWRIIDAGLFTWCLKLVGRRVGRLFGRVSDDDDDFADRSRQSLYGIAFQKIQKLTASFSRGGGGEDDEEL